MIVLGIETSCDETAASVVSGKKILSNVVFSQIDVHKEYGGVVPELASRKHIECISQVIDLASKEAGVALSHLQGIGVTRGPGLIGSLLVGIGAAKAMALGLNIPITGVNHLHGHLFAVFLENEGIEFPFMGLVVSGGHTSLYLVRNFFDIERVGKTRDDAAGEAFDKVAKLLGLGYPGGVAIEGLVQDSDSDGLRLPQALLEKDNFDFSFSGLKTAVLRQVENLFGRKSATGRPGSFYPICAENMDTDQGIGIKKIAAAFQDSVVQVLAKKAVNAAKYYNCKQLVICGGVAANRALREKTISLACSARVQVLFPSFGLCTDNAAMIAVRAEDLLSAGFVDDLSFDAKSRW